MKYFEITITNQNEEIIFQKSYLGYEAKLTFKTHKQEILDSIPNYKDIKDQLLITITPKIVK